METRVTIKGRITIPVVLRQRFGIKAGTRIVFAVSENDQENIVTPITRQYVHSLRGKYKGTDLLKTLMSERRLA